MGSETRPASRLAGFFVGLVRRNILLKLLSVALALGFWAWVKAEQVVEMTGRVEVEYRYPEGIVPVEPGPRSVTVTLSGALGQMATLNWDDLSIMVDTSDATEGGLSLDFTDRSLGGLPKSLNVERVSPPAVDLQLDLVMSRSTYIGPIIVGQPARGYLAGDPVVSPSTVEISGPQSLVQNLVELKTDFVDISGAELDLDVVVDIAIESSSIEPESHRVHVHVPIQPVMDERKLASIPVRVEGENWSPVTEYIGATWQGPMLTLEQLVSDQVYVLATPPDEPPENGVVELSLREDSQSIGFTLQHLAERDSIRLIGTEPSTIFLVYQAPEGAPDGEGETP